MKLIDMTLKMRMDNIRNEIPKFWRDLAKDIDPEADLITMRNVITGKSHDEYSVKMFEKIVIKNRALQAVEH
jgi:hypothetical protein